MPVSSISQFKASGGDGSTVPLRDQLAQFLGAKHFPVEDVRTLAQAGSLGELVCKLVLRSHPDTLASLFNFYGATFESLPPSDYRATASENQAIDRAFFDSPRRNDSFPDSEFRGIAAHDFLELPRQFDLPARVRRLSIGVMGLGPSGRMVLRALTRLGFSSITAFDRHLSGAGIWGRENVRRARNNPRLLYYDGVQLAQTTPSDGGGEDVLRFTRKLSAFNGIKLVEDSVTQVEPRQFQHRVTTSDGIVRDFQILFNCVGLGKPKPLHDPERMKTTATATEAGYRWQQNLSGAGQVEGKSFVLIGLGNSTGEMLVQLQKLEDHGVELDYHVLTHYPKDAIFNPDQTVEHQHRSYRVFRDLSQPNLVDYAGDLENLRTAFERARAAGRVHSDIKFWKPIDGEVHFGGNAKMIRHRACSKGGMYTLTGYRWEAEDYRNMGIALRSDGYPAVAYDGEFTGGRGYFGLGPIIETPENRNALVIPGNIFRMQDLLFTFILRALEAARR